MRFSTTFCLAQTALPLFLATPVLGAYISARQTTDTCNGHTELCNRSFGNITFVGAHNSYAVGTNNLATNQDYDVTQQLNDGVRLLQMQAHNKTGIIQLCHTSCFLFDGGSLQSYLTKVKSWMDVNPTEVISMLIVNSDGFKPADFAAVYQATGMATLSYSPLTATLGASDWPTLSTLIAAGTRAVTFLDAQANFDSVPYLIDEFTNVWETAFDVTDTAFNCSVDRTKGDTASQLYLINHFFDKLVLGQPVPDRNSANMTNAASGPGSLGQQVSTCVDEHGQNPNFMLVDFYEFGGGSVFEVAAAANGVTYAPAISIATPLSETSASSAGSDSAATRLSLGPSHWVPTLLVASGLFFGVVVI